MVAGLWVPLTLANCHSQTLRPEGLKILAQLLSFFFSVSDALRYPFKKGSLRALLTEVGHVLIIVVSILFSFI